MLKKDRFMHVNHFQPGYSYVSHRYSSIFSQLETGKRHKQMENSHNYCTSYIKLLVKHITSIL